MLTGAKAKKMLSEDRKLLEKKLENIAEKESNKGKYYGLDKEDEDMQKIAYYIAVTREKTGDISNKGEYATILYNHSKRKERINQVRSAKFLVAIESKRKSK